MVNTQPLTTFAAKSQEEMIICKDLANSISERISLCMKVFFTPTKLRIVLAKINKGVREGHENCRETGGKEIGAEEGVREGHENCREREGDEPNSQEEREKIRANPINRPSIVYALVAVSFNKRVTPQRKGKEKMHEVKMEVDNE